MGLQTNRVPEIVAPAGNLEKLKVAVNYGADAVYFGGDNFNLRVQADNFSNEDIAEAIDYCSERNVKTIFLMNSYLHESEITLVKDYIKSIRRNRFDAIMVSDPGMLMLLQEAGITSKIHLSTQMSTLNHMSVKFWNKAGIDRIVLARETTLKEIKLIRDNTDSEIEVFVHGALCVSYSGRCLLSRYLSGRDANRGDCSHPCRWRYTLIEEKRPGSYLDIIEYPPVDDSGKKISGGTEILSSMDLCLIEKIPEYIDAGVSAFKIEGRMKSLYYVANITRIYKEAVKHAGTDMFNTLLPFWKDELDLVSHRPYTDDLFNEFGSMGFRELPMVKKALFLGYAIAQGADNNSVYVKIFNPIRIGEKLEAIYPINEKNMDSMITVIGIFQKDGSAVDIARSSGIYLIKFDDSMHIHGILRRRI